MANALASDEIRVSDHYERNVVEYEKIRLDHDSPVEQALTLRALDKWIKDRSTILDVGVGTGHYATHLAKRGCNIHLVDICESFLSLTQKKLQEHHLEEKILSATRASATHLYSLGDASVDAVLMLGPFYHLIDRGARNKAVKEAHRVLKKGGFLFAAGINRLAILHELFHSARYFGEKKIDVLRLKALLEEYCQTGVSNEELFPPLGDAYCCTVEEFLDLFSSFFTQIDFLGLESFSAFHQKTTFDYSPEERQLWISILEKTARTIEGIASSEHFLYVGKKQ